MNYEMLFFMNFFGKRKLLFVDGNALGIVMLLLGKEVQVLQWCTVVE